MAELSPQALYTKELIHKGRGYPFWNPEPDSSAPPRFRRHGVACGDLGIMNNSGGFDYLFNIFHVATHEINDGRVPPDFEPLPPLRNTELQRRIDPAKVIASKHASFSEISASVSAQGSPSDSGVGVSFDVSRAEESEAILFLPNYAKRYDALNKAKIREYCQKHGVSWYNYVNGSLGRDAPRGSLYLITGCHKATTWGNAVVGRADRSFTLSLRCILKDIGGVTVNVANSWVGDSGVETGLFPNPDIRYSYPDRQNQCVFARGFSISVSKSLISQSWETSLHTIDTSSKCKIPSLGNNHVPVPSTDRGTGLWTRLVSSLFRFKTVSAPHQVMAESADSYGSQVAEVYEFPPVGSQLSNPSAAMNAYLLSKDSSLEIAITHDEEWMEVMKNEKDTHLTEEELWCKLKDYLDVKLSNDVAADEVGVPPVTTPTPTPSHSEMTSSEFAPLCIDDGWEHISDRQHREDEAVTIPVFTETGIAESSINVPFSLNSIIPVIPDPLAPENTTISAFTETGIAESSINVPLSLNSIIPVIPDPHPLVPENTIVFDTDERTRREPRIQSARRYLTDVARYCPNGVGEAIVKKIEHRKSSEAPNHEFLLCYVQDRNVPTRLAVIRIERFNKNHVTPDRGVPPALSPAALLALDAMRSSSPSLFGKAVDFFTITCDIDAKRRSGDTLSTLLFDDNSGFTADEAAMICKIASECADEYNALGHQCFWYAGVIYKIIQEIYANRFKEMLAEGNRRKGMGHSVKIRMKIFIPPDHAPEKLAQTHRQKWPEWKDDIKMAKKKKQELDILRQKLAARG